MRYEKVVQSPIGPLTLVGDESFVFVLHFGDFAAGHPSCPVLEQAAEELEEYFAGKRREFTVPLCPNGTEFQSVVWAALQTIPYGETVSYGDIAERIGKPTAYRAVGGANNKNPLPIFIPCHRVVGKKGTLIGYAGGLAIKEFLLRLEQT